MPSPLPFFFFFFFGGGGEYGCFMNYIYGNFHSFFLGGGGVGWGGVETSSSKHACSVPTRPSSL